jgi:hypothetical protein
VKREAEAVRGMNEDVRAARGTSWGAGAVRDAGGALGPRVVLAMSPGPHVA